MMNEEEKNNVSRRKFLYTGAAAAAVSSIISIKAIAATESEQLPETANSGMTNNSALAGDPVTTTDPQILENKTISSRNNVSGTDGNILGTDYLNIREFGITGTDITRALTDAINELKLSPEGGQILIPHGIWTSDGGHDIPRSVSIEGVGYHPSPNIGGTEIKMNNSSTKAYMFGVISNEVKNDNSSLKNLLINLNDLSGKIGLLMKSINPLILTGIYNTCVENVGFSHCAYGIKVDSPINGNTRTNFECILNRFERVSFFGCGVGFYCNTSNTGFTFDNCYFELLVNQTALDCEYMGNLSLNHCLFVSNQGSPPISGTTILKTLGAFNNISFYDCQDEGIEFAYKSATNNYPYVALVYRNCLIQSMFQFNANGEVIFDSCRIGVRDDELEEDPPVEYFAVKDSTNGYARVQLRGLNNIFTNTNQIGGKIAKFVNQYSQVIYETKDVGLPVISPTRVDIGLYSINATRGEVTFFEGEITIRVLNNLIGSDSLVFTQLRTKDMGGARISEVICGPFYFDIFLTQKADNDLSVGFLISR